MPTLRVPYQCILRTENFLIAARGSSIDLSTVKEPSRTSTWECPTAQGRSSKDGCQSTAQQSPVKDLASPALQDAEATQLSPPAKRRKLSDEGTSQNPDDTEPKSKKKSNNRSDSVAAGLEAPAVTTLAITRNGQHVIAVTGEDKSIRVFEIAFDGDGMHYLKSVSQRSVRNWLYGPMLEQLEADSEAG